MAVHQGPDGFAADLPGHHIVVRAIGSVPADGHRAGGRLGRDAGHGGGGGGQGDVAAVGRGAAAHGVIGTDAVADLLARGGGGVDEAGVRDLVVHQGPGVLAADLPGHHVVVRAIGRVPADGDGAGGRLGRDTGHSAGSRGSGGGDQPGEHGVVRPGHEDGIIRRAQGIVQGGDQGSSFEVGCIERHVVFIGFTSQGVYCGQRGGSTFRNIADGVQIKICCHIGKGS